MIGLIAISIYIASILFFYMFGMYQGVEHYKKVEALEKQERGQEKVVHIMDGKKLVGKQNIQKEFAFTFRKFDGYEIQRINQN